MSEEHKRKLGDYMEICPECHGIYDKLKGFRKKRGDDSGE